MPNVTVFDGNDNAYQRWLADNPSGYVCNTSRLMKPKYMVLHRSHCRTIRFYHDMAKPGAYTERDYIKICSIELNELRKWVKAHGRHDGSFSKECSFCN